jgi:hypothetical protein
MRIAAAANRNDKRSTTVRRRGVYRTIPPEYLLWLMGVLDHSYQFARMFNEDKELRTGLWKVGEFQYRVHVEEFA